MANIRIIGDFLLNLRRYLGLFKDKPTKKVNVKLNNGLEIPQISVGTWRATTLPR
jgi:hypothetical protein